MGRLCPNIRRRSGAYWFTKKLKIPTGWKAVEFSLKIREPRLATMVGAQVNAQFHLLSPLAVSGTITIKQFQAALGEIAANVADARRQAQFEFPTGQREHPAAGTAGDFAAELVDGDIKAGKFLELVARHGKRMKDASFFVEVPDQNGFSDEEIRVLLVEYLGEIDNLLASRDGGEFAPSCSSPLKSAGLSDSQMAQPFVAQAVLATTGKAMVKSAEAGLANDNFFDLDALVAHAVRSDGEEPPTPAVSPTPSQAAIVATSNEPVSSGQGLPSVEGHPFLLYYSGARRDEICGLHCDDVVLDDAIPHVEIRDNAQRRLKNAQSERKIPLHGEILRLGFAQYVREIKRLGYDLLFPDLYSPTTNSPLGDRLYDELAKGLATAVPEAGARKKVLHSLRHTVGAKLKDEGVIPEIRADLLGHGGANVTEEIYAGATALERLRCVIERLPVVTGHLSAPDTTNLLPWVAARQKAPWARSRRKPM